MSYVVYFLLILTNLLVLVGHSPEGIWANLFVAGMVFGLVVAHLIDNYKESR